MIEFKNRSKFRGVRARFTSGNSARFVHSDSQTFKCKKKKKVDLNICENFIRLRISFFFFFISCSFLIFVKHQHLWGIKISLCYPVSPIKSILSSYSTYCCYSGSTLTRKKSRLNYISATLRISNFERFYCCGTGVIGYRH